MKYFEAHIIGFTVYDLPRKGQILISKYNFYLFILSVLILLILLILPIWQKKRLNLYPLLKNVCSWKQLYLMAFFREYLRQIFTKYIRIISLPLNFPINRANNPFDIPRALFIPKYMIMFRAKGAQHTINYYKCFRCSAGLDRRG